MMRLIRWLSTAALLALPIGCSPSPEAPASPGGPGSRRPALSTDSSGNLIMSWVEPAAAATDRRAAGAAARDSSRSHSHAIAWATFDGVRWSSVSTLVRSDRLFTNWADVQRLIRLDDGSLLGAWGATVGGSRLATNLVVGQAPPDVAGPHDQVVHGDSSATQHGFATLVGTGNGAVVIWLDGRETALDDGVTSEAEWGNMTLRAARLGRDGRVTGETLLDERVCDCCPTAGARTASGALIAYRNRTEDERRDIQLIRYEDGKFTAPYALHDDGWIMRGCPVNGPALDASDERVAAAWFTAPDDRPVVLAAFSNDGGRTFSSPIPVDANRPNGRVGVALLPDGSAAVSWIGRYERESVIYVARVTENGVDPPAIVARPQSPAFTGIPAIGRVGDGVLVAWTDGSHPDSTRVRTAHLEM